MAVIFYIPLYNLKKMKKAFFVACIGATAESNLLLNQHVADVSPMKTAADAALKNAAAADVKATEADADKVAAVAG